MTATQLLQYTAIRITRTMPRTLFVLHEHAYMWTVMVHDGDAVVAVPAVSAPRRPRDVACDAVVQL